MYPQKHRNITHGRCRTGQEEIGGKEMADEEWGILLSVFPQQWLSFLHIHCLNMPEIPLYASDEPIGS